MPDMGGIELQKQLAARQIHIPIILLTGYADVSMAVHAFKAGVFDLIEKPCDNAVLLKRIKEALALGSDSHQESELAFLALASMGDGVITTDRNGSIIYLNHTAEQLTGWDKADARGKSLQDVFRVLDETTREPITDLLTLCFKEGQDPDGEENRLVLIRRDKQELPIEQSLAPIRDQEGNTVGAVILFQDATQTRDITRRLSYQASHDPLTGLVNRREFERRLERVLENALERKSEHILCYLDLDRFKTVNDTAGHTAGDELLRQISTLWSKRLRQRDTLARLGGDEFAILLEHCPLDQGIAIANELVKTTQDFHFEWEGKTFAIGVSIGVTAITAATKTSKQIMQLVDAACYAAKREGRNRIHIHYSSEGKQPRNWVTYLDQALRDDRMQLFYQIITPSVKEKHREHYQILLRMQNADEEEAVTMGMFLPAQERAGLAPVLDRWVIRQVFHWLISKPEYLLRAQFCAFNMSRYTLEDKAFPVFLKRQLEHHDIPATKLCLVFSESTLTSHIDGAQRLLHALKEIGCYVAVDDFASTPSGFSYLRRLPVDFLKMDGRAIKNAVNDPVVFAIVKSTHEIAQLMGIQTIAKGVDDTVIADKIRPLGIDYWQGYYIAKPVRFED
jgi:diguanylate cyclase (GGDEF)-like protein/PAS domain S-box-containing protein